MTEITKILEVVAGALFQVAVVAFVVEAAWEGLKPLRGKRLQEWENREGIPIDRIFTTLFSVAICLGAKVDILAEANIQIPMLGSLLTGLAARELASWWHNKKAQGEIQFQKNKPAVLLDDAGMGDSK